jgi:NAD+ kinase
MIVVTPICPYSLSARPTVVSHGDSVRICFTNCPETVISFDGESMKLADVGHGEAEILVTLSKFVTNTIKTNNYGFYEIVRMKIGNTDKR